MSWMAILVLVLVVVQLIAALFSVWQKDLLLAVLGTSAVSVVLSVLFYLLQAPDVALTEAAIGVALSTIIFVIAIKKTDRYEE
jgi:multicomponent Na+:H+ antiporter subunit A